MRYEVNKNGTLLWGRDGKPIPRVKFVCDRCNKAKFGWTDENRETYKRYRLARIFGCHSDDPEFQDACVALSEEEEQIERYLRGRRTQRTD